MSALGTGPPAVPSPQAAYISICANGRTVDPIEKNVVPERKIGADHGILYLRVLSIPDRFYPRGLGFTWETQFSGLRILQYGPNGLATCPALDNCAVFSPLAEETTAAKQWSNIAKSSALKIGSPRRNLTPWGKRGPE